MPQLPWHLIKASNIKKWQCLLQREIEKEGCKLGMKTTMERNREPLGVASTKKIEINIFKIISKHKRGKFIITTERQMLLTG